MKNLLISGLLIIGSWAYSQRADNAWIDAFGKYESGAYNEALQAFTSLQSENHQDEEKVALYKGISEFRLHKYSLALNDFKTMSNSGSQDDNIWIARTYGELKDKQNTLLYLERYLNNYHGSSIDEVNKDTSFRFLHSSDEWFELWQKDWLSGTAKIIDDAAYYLKKEDYSKAHQVIEDEISENGSKAELRAFNCKIYCQEGNNELALNEINQAITAEPANADFLKQRAGIYKAMGKNNEAIEDLTAVLKQNPEDFKSRYNRAEAALNAKELDLAQSDIKLYLQYFSTDEALFMGGQIYYASEEYITALKYFNRLMERQNPNARYFRARGMTYYQTNTYEMAASDLSMSLDIEPDNAETNLYLGLAELNRGNKKSACYYLKRAQRFGDLTAVEYLNKNCKE